MSLTPSEFEQTVGYILDAEGYRGVRVAGRTGDRGVDLRCVDPHGRSTIVQCKQYSSKRVGGPEVRNLIGARHQDGAQHAILATTSTFTGEALAAAASGGLHLLNG